MRYARPLFVAALCAFALPVAGVSAADPVTVNQSARAVSALNGNLIYLRKPHGEYVCMRRVGGKVSRASRLPLNGCGGGGPRSQRGGHPAFPPLRRHRPARGVA